MALRKLFKRLMIIILGVIFFFFVALFAFLNSEKIQTLTAKKTADFLSNNLNTEISLRAVKIDLSGDINISDFIMRDQQNDTLFYLSMLVLNPGLINLLKKDIVVESLHIQKPKIRLNQIDSLNYNFSFLFPPKDTTKKSGFNWPIIIHEASIHFLDFKFQNASTNIDVINKELLLSGFIDLKENLINTGNIELNEPIVFIRNSNQVQKVTTNSSAFSDILIPDIGLNIINQKFQLKNGAFALQQGDTISFQSGKFNSKNIDLDNINIQWNSLDWKQNRLMTSIDSLSFEEQSGLNITHFQTRVLLSDTSIKADNLVLKSNHSNVNFNGSFGFDSPSAFYQLSEDNWISANFLNTYLSSKDLFYFIDSTDLPAIPEYVLNGKINGTIDKFYADNIRLDIGKKSKLLITGIVENVLSTDKLNWDFEQIEIHAYKKDLNPFLENLLSGTDIFYYPFYSLQGKASGNFYSAKLENTIVEAGNTLWLKLNGFYNYSKNINNIESQLDFDLRQLTKGALRPFISENKWVEALEKFRLKGKLKQENGSANTSFQIQSNAGLLDIIAKTSLDKNYMPLDYSANISTNKFNLAVLPIDTSLKNLEFNIDITGNGTNPETMQAQMQMQVDNLEYKQHEWSGITLDAQWKNQQLISGINIKDAMAGLGLKGAWQPGKKDSIALYWNIDSFKINAIAKAYKTLQIASKGNATYIGDFDQQHLVKANIDQLQLKDSTTSFSQKEMKFSFSQLDSLESEGDFSSNIINAKWQGPGTEYWPILPGSLIQMTDSYFPLSELLGLEIENRNKEILNQAINVQLTLSHPAEWLSIFLPSFKKLDTLDFHLDWNPTESKITVDAYAPEINYADMGWKQMNLNAQGGESGFDFVLETDSLFFKKLLKLNTLQFKSNIINDSLYSSINILDDSTNKLLSINNLYTQDKQSNRFKLFFREPFVLNKENWEVDKSNFIYLGIEEFDFEPLVLKKGEQYFQIGKNKGKVNALHTQFKNLQINEFTEIISLTQPDIQGEIDGSVVFGWSPELMLDGDITFNDLLIENTKAGKLDLTASISDNTAVWDASLKGPNGEMQVFGDYNLDNGKLDATAEVPKLPIAFITAFLPEYVDSSSGYISAMATAKGKLENPVFTGKLSLHKLKSWIVPLKTYYTIDAENIEIDNKNFLVKNLDLKDRYGSSAVFKGSIKHNNFSRLDMYLQMKASDFTFFEIPKNEKELLSGTLRLNLDAKLRGSLEKPVVELDAKTKETTDLLVSLIDEKEAIMQQDHVFYYDPELADTTKEKKLLLSESGFSLFMNLQATDDAKMQIIVDPISGDYLEINGNSNLSVDIEPNKTPVITGTYTVKSGAYRFSYEQVMKKRFNILEDSKINFTGDPMDAQLAINAEYSTETTTYELIEDQSATLSESERDAARKKTKVNVLLNIGGTLSKPELSFDIRLPGGQSNIVSSAVARKLAQLRLDESELNKQVFGLLVFNSFISNGDGGIGSSGEAAALSSISRLINNQLNKLASNHLKAIDISFAFDAYKDKFSETDKTITEVGLDLSKDFLNDRLSVKVGGNLNLEDESVSTEEARAMQQVSNNFVIEYKLTENGRYRVKVFQTANYDLINNNNVFRTGAGISFHETFGKIFKEKDSDKKAEKTSEEAEGNED